MIVPRNKREERLVLIDDMKTFLSVKAFSTAEMVLKLSVEQATVRKYMKLIPCEPGHRVFIEKWQMFNLRWVPYYRYGVGEDAPMPHMTSKEKQAKAALRRRNRKAGIVTKPAYQPKRIRPRKPGRTPQQVAAQREAFEREQKAAAIQPHMDPWASLFHGGVNKLVGATA